MVLANYSVDWEVYTDESETYFPVPFYPNSFNVLTRGDYKFL